LRSRYNNLQNILKAHKLSIEILLPSKNRIYSKLKIIIPENETINKREKISNSVDKAFEKELINEMNLLNGEKSR
jgi:hypothetical protein